MPALVCTAPEQVEMQSQPRPAVAARETEIAAEWTGRGRQALDRMSRAPVATLKMLLEAVPGH